VFELLKVGCGILIALIIAIAIGSWIFSAFGLIPVLVYAGLLAAVIGFVVLMVKNPAGPGPWDPYA